MTPESKTRPKDIPDNSLLKRVSFSEIREHQKFNGTLEDVFNSLLSTLDNPESCKAPLLFQPARIINAILAQKVDLGSKIDLRIPIEALISPATEMALSVYREEKDAKDKVLTKKNYQRIKHSLFRKKGFGKS
ncbi:hypothetical protein KKG52_00740 [Patescibacteria group bacterium]|nr:hypothetical protein [Patescibacteria group bacterium]